MSQEIHRFEDFDLDQSAHELRRNGCVIHLERIPFEFLCLLVERGGQLVTRDEILDRVWGKGVFIHAESSINTAMRKIRRALNDDSDPPKFVVTIPAKGYRFMASVQTLNGNLKTNSESVQVSSTGPFRGSTLGRVHNWWQIGAWSASGLAIIAAAILLARHPSLHPAKRFTVVSSLDRPARKLADRSSVAVLPFVNLSGDKEQEYFIDGITDNLINALSRLTNIFVIARTSSFTYKDRAPKAPEIGRELRVKYLLEGSVQRAGNSVRVNTQLVNAATGGILWAERYDTSLRDIFVLQDEIVQKIVTTLSHQADDWEKGHDSRALSLTAPGPPGCYDPADFGAVPDDGIDDSAPSQQALDAASVAGGRVCFGHGRWRLSRARGDTYNRFAALSTHGAHVDIQGAGPETVLEVVGDQGGTTTWVISVDPGARDITIRDLTIDTSATTNTDEQFHAIEVGNGIGTGTVEDVRIEHVRFEHPDATDGSRKGDCLHMVGSTPQSAVRRVTVIGVTFAHCARSDIAIQRNVFDLIIQENQFTRSSDQDIGSEPMTKGQQS